ncbi:hypothetical protein ACLOJK_020213 [Asimina triloba]
MPLLCKLAAAAAMGGHAALRSEEYWKKMLPETPMPGAIKDLIQPVNDPTDEEKTVSTAGVGVGVGVGVGNRGDGAGVVVGPPGHKGKPVVIVRPPNPFFYSYVGSADQTHDDPTLTLFFLEKDLHPGAKMSLVFPNTTAGAAFLPRQAADALPFSSDKFKEILRHFSIQQQTPEANAMRATLQKCEAPAAGGETRCCATSLESMIDCTASILGTQVRVLTSRVRKEAPRQKYTVGAGVQKLAQPKSVTCHMQDYAYAVYYCHATRATSMYAVPLIGEDGTRVDAIAVSHTDTSKWNPQHVAFQLLKVRPGSVPLGTARG